MGRVPLSSRGQIWRALLTLTLANMGRGTTAHCQVTFYLSFLMNEHRRRRALSSVIFFLHTAGQIGVYI